MKLIRDVYIFLLIIFVLTATAGKAQPRGDCRTATNYYTKRIVRLYEARELDSIDIYIKRWDERCEEIEELQRLKMLWSIKNDEFNEDIYNYKIINHLIEYREKVLMEQDPSSLSDFEREYRKYIYSNEQFNKFTKTLASEMIEERSDDSIASMFTQYYANQFDSFFEKIKKPEIRDSKLYKYYKYYLKELRSRRESYVAAIAGYWLPGKKIALYGNHPSLGFCLGFKTNKNTSQLTTILRFIKGSDFLYFQNGQLNRSHFVRSFLIALEQRRDIKRSKNSEYNIGFGIGIEHFSVSLPFPERPLDHLQSFMLNIEFGYRYFKTQNHSRFSDIQLVANRYGSGEYSITVRFTYGFNLNNKKNELMEFLKY